MNTTLLLKILTWLLLAGIQALILAAIVVLAVFNRRHFKKYWKPGLVVGIAIFLMSVPGIVFTFAHFDGSLVKDEVRWLTLIGMVIGCFMQALLVGWNMVLYVVAVSEWNKAGGGPLGGGSRRPFAWRNTAGAFAFGVFAASATVVVFAFLEIQEGDFVVTLRRLFPGVESAAPLVVIPVTILSLAAGAMSEELLYRGGMLAFAVRQTRTRPVLRWLCVIAITLAWAIAHVWNTDNPAAKMTQIFVIGVALAEIARRDCLRSAIAAHIGLNVTSVALAYFCAWLYGA